MPSATAVATAYAFMFLSLMPPVKADCAFDIEDLRGRIAHSEDKARVIAVRTELQKADEARRTSEVECHNRVVRAWRYWRAEPEGGAGGGPAAANPNPATPNPYGGNR